VIHAYTLKPLLIHAVQWTGENTVEVIDLIHRIDGCPEDEITYVDHGVWVILNLFRGEFHLKRWDYLVLTPGGELHVFNAREFTKRYEHRWYHTRVYEATKLRLNWAAATATSVVNILKIHLKLWGQL